MPNREQWICIPCYEEWEGILPDRTWHMKEDEVERIIDGIKDRRASDALYEALKESKHVAN